MTSLWTPWAAKAAALASPSLESFCRLSAITVGPAPLRGNTEGSGPLSRGEHLLHPRHQTFSIGLMQSVFHRKRQAVKGPLPQGRG